MAWTRSIALRGSIAIALMVGFYGLALVVSGGLLALPILTYVGTGRVYVRLSFATILGGALILWSIVPRRDVFSDPGPQVEPAEQRGLFALIEEIARSAGQTMPSAVFVVPDLNAFVAERGGWMGIGSQRIMGIGLPLLQVLSISQLRAVLAHEFGHYHGGDTRLGPWVYKTRSAIDRTLENFGEVWLRKPFEWYARVFLRVSLAVSRHQEYAADRLAATLVGAGPLAKGLERIAGASHAYSTFWQSEFIPGLEAGFRPPLAEGFARFLAAPGVEEQMQGIVSHELAEGKGDPYDTHPCLGDRLTALAGHPDTAAGVERPAIGLIANIARLEKRLLSFLFTDSAVGELKQVNWQDLAEQAYLPVWREYAASMGPFLDALAPESIPDAVAQLSENSRNLDELSGQPLSAEERVAFAGAIIGWSLSSVLADRGWAVHGGPGEPPSLRCGGRHIEPFSIVARLVARDLAKSDWQLTCRELGIEGLDLFDAVGARDREVAPLPQEHDAAKGVPRSSPLRVWGTAVAALVAGLMGLALQAERIEAFDWPGLVLPSMAIGVVTAGFSLFKMHKAGSLRALGLVDGRSITRLMLMHSVAMTALAAAALAYIS